MLIISKVIQLRQTTPAVTAHYVDIVYLSGCEENRENWTNLIEGVREETEK